MKKENVEISCSCGCGKMLMKYDNRGRERRMLAGHNKSTKGIPMSEEHKIKLSESLKKNEKNSERLRLMCKNKLGRHFPNTQGENHWRWSADKIDYLSLHIWVKRNLGKPTKCEHCGKEGKTEWANKDHSYKRSLIGWIALCNKCHKVLDKTNPPGKKEYIRKQKEWYETIRNNLHNTDTA